MYSKDLWKNYLLMAGIICLMLLPLLDAKVSASSTFHVEGENTPNGKVAHFLRSQQRQYTPKSPNIRGLEAVTPRMFGVGGARLALDDMLLFPFGENTPPEVPNGAYIMPSRLTQSSDLQLVYSYFDADGDPEGATIIHWYRNGVLQPQFDGQPIIPASQIELVPGDLWYATIQPHDGSELGEIVTTPVVIVNTPPQLANVQLMPAEPALNDSLSLSYQYSDQDDDPESDGMIRWYKDDVLQKKINDQAIVPHQVTSAGERWYVTISVFDGYEYSDVFTTTEVIIGAHELSLLYLPIIAREGQPPSTCPYEPNDSAETADGPLIFAQSYEACPEDLNDWYYFVITETSSLEVEVSNYTPAPEGQVVVYQEYLDADNQLQWLALANDGRGGSTMTTAILNSLSHGAVKNTDA